MTGLGVLLSRVTEADDQEGRLHTCEYTQPASVVGDRVIFDYAC